MFIWIDRQEIGLSLIAKFMGPTWGPAGADRTQVGPMLATWTLLSVYMDLNDVIEKSEFMIKYNEYICV